MTASTANANVQRLAPATSASIRAGLAYPRLANVVAALVETALQHCNGGSDSSSANHTERIDVEIRLAPEWEVGCYISSGARRSVSVELFDRLRQDETLSHLSYLGLLDIEMRDRSKLLRKGSVILFDGEVARSSYNATEHDLQIILRNVFKTIPVRRSTLLSSSYARSELDECNKVCSALSLLRPRVRICVFAAMPYRSRARMVLDIPAHSCLEDRYDFLYGVDLRDKGVEQIAHHSSSADPLLAIHGQAYMTPSRLHAQQHAFVNGKLVQSSRDDSIASSIEPNLHLEYLHRAICKYMSSKITQAHVDQAIPRYMGYIVFLTADDVNFRQAPLAKFEAGIIFKHERLGLCTNGSQKINAITNDRRRQQTAAREHDIVYTRRKRRRAECESGSLSFDIEDIDEVVPAINTRKGPTVDDLKDAAVIGQVDGKYVSCRLMSGSLVLIDQHAAHERIRFERLLGEYATACAEGTIRKTLDIPGSRKCSIKAPKVVCDMLAEADAQTVLRFWGFEIKVSKSARVSSIRLCALPNQLYARLVQQRQLGQDLLNELVTWLQDGPLRVRVKDVEHFRRHLEQVDKREKSRRWTPILRFAPPCLVGLFASLACRGSIMFNDDLNKEQCSRLVEQLSSTIYPSYCAHGRPSVASLAEMNNTEVDSNSSPDELCDISWEAL